MTRNDHAMFWLCPLGLVLSTAVSAQLPLYTVNGDGSGDLLGNSVAIVGDVNGDGHADLVVGAPGDDDNGTDSGSVKMISGFDGSTLDTFLGAAAGDEFGTSVSGAGDVDGDGRDDVIVGAPLNDGTDTDAGAAYVYSGFDGSVLHTLLGAAANDEFGTSVSGAGDVDGDGYDDVIVGAPLNDSAFTDAGAAYVYSGLDGSVLHTLLGGVAGDGFGYAVSGAGDVDADCFDDVIVGAPLADPNGSQSGTAQVHSGFDGSVLDTFDGDSMDDNFGWSVGGGGDVDGDGTVDLIVGAPLDDSNGVDAGSVFVFSGATGSAIHVFPGDASEDAMGWSVAGAGDVDRDGLADIVGGAPLNDAGGFNSGTAAVWSGADGSRLETVEPSGAGNRMGTSVGGARDVDGDGFSDVIVGSPQANGEAGEATAYARPPYDTHTEVNAISQGLSTNAQFGVRMKRCGDVDDDGFTDYIVGAVFDVSTLGSAHVFSGADNTLIRTHIGGPFSNSWYGIRVGGVGDVNSDGHDDYGVGGWHDDTAGTDAGLARVYSGIDGAPLYEFFGASPKDHLGSAVDALGDVDGDLVDDFLIGVGKGNGDVGFVDVRSGADGSILYAVSGVHVGEWFGWSGAACGDVDGDGIGDFIVGAPSGQTTPQANGYAQVFSGVDGSLIWSFNGDAAGDRFGWIVNGAGDVNRDGVPDLIVGADGADPGGLDGAGLARVFSGADGTMLYEYTGEAAGDGLGLGADSAGDVNGDGFDDFVIGAPTFDPVGLSNAGKAYLYSGFDGSLLQSFEGDTDDDELGRGVLGTFSDSDGDGYPEVVIGLPKDDLGGTDYGAIRIFESSVKTDPAYFTLYGAGCPGSNGDLPRLIFGGRPAIGEMFDVDLASAPVSASATLGFDVATISLTLPGAPGCTILALPVFGAPTTTDTSGKAGFDFLTPNDPLFIGGTLYVQWFILDGAANGLGVVMSKGGCINIGNP